MTTLQSIDIPQVAQKSKLDRLAEMHDLHTQGYSYAKIGQQFNISRARIHQIISGYDRLNGAMQGCGWYAQTRNIVLKRDNHSCQNCFGDGTLIIHHIDGNDRNNDLSNLVTFCPRCHVILHKLLQREKKREKYYVKFICQICKRPFTVRRSVVKRQQKRIEAGLKVHLPRFCSKKCYGSWFGKTHGRGRGTQSPLIKS